MSKTVNKRNVNVDIIKAILITLVVIGHVVSYLYPDSFRTNLIYKICYSFHMPFFILVSGYLTAFKSDDKLADKKFFISRITRLLIPYLIWNVFETILTKNINIFFVVFMKPVLWFLFVLFLYECIIHIASKFKRKEIAMAIMYFAIVSLLIIFKRSSDILVAFTIYYPFWVLGFYFNRMRKNKILDFIYSKSWIAIILYPLSMLLYTYDQYEIMVPYFTSLLNNKVPSIIILAVYNVYNRYVVAMLGILFVATIVKIIVSKVKPNINEKIAVVGKYTMYIYILEKWFEFQIFNNVYIDGVILTIVKMVVPILIALIVKYIKPINRLLFGEK